MIPGDYTIQLLRGRAEIIRCQLFQDKAATLPVDLTGCTPAAGISTPAGNVPLDCDVVEEGAIDATDGYVDVTVTAEQAADLTGSFYSWSLGITDSLGDWNPCLQGPVLVNPDPSL